MRSPTAQVTTASYISPVFSAAAQCSLDTLSVPSASCITYLVPHTGLDFTRFCVYFHLVFLQKKRVSTTLLFLNLEINFVAQVNFMVECICILNIKLPFNLNN